MSELAERQRLRRRGWAATGSSHDRLIGTLRILLPLAVGVLAALLALAPMTLGRDISFILSKDRVDVASERMRIARAAYRGTDAKGQPFSLDAASAVQATSREPIVRLQHMHGHIALASGPGTLVADRGRYNLDTKRLAIDGPTRYDGAGGYRLVTSDVLVDLDDKLMMSRGAATGAIPIGTFSADRLRADLDRQVVDLVGRAHLHITQARRRGAR